MFKARPMSVNKMIGAAQDGLRAMSSNVAFGEKNTPMIRPIELIAGWDCASGAGKDAVVAIEVPPQRRRRHRRISPPFYPALRQNTRKISSPVGAQLYPEHSRRNAAPQLGTLYLAPAFRSGLRRLPEIAIRPKRPLRAERYADGTGRYFNRSRKGGSMPCVRRSTLICATCRAS